MDLTPKPISLAIAAHPLTGDTDLRYVQAGHTLVETLAAHGIEGPGWIVTVGGHEVAPEHWPRVRVKAGQMVEARSVVRRQVAQIAAIVALSYFTFGAGGLALGAAAGGAAGTTAGLFAAGGAIGGGFWAAAATYAAGSLLINAVLAPKPTAAASSGNATQNPTYSLSGGRNQPRQFEPLALVLGETKVVPDLAGQQYTEYRGESQYLTALFHAGINCASVDQFKVGDTLLSSYEGVEVIRAGFPSGNAGVLRSTSVDTVAGALLDNTSGIDGGGTWVTRTTSPGTVRIGIDLEATLTAVDTAGTYQPHGVSVELQYCPTGTGAWAPYLGGAHELVSVGTTPYRNTVLLDVPSGQYDVRARKNSINDTATTLQNTVTWSQLKSYQPDAADYAGQPRVQIDIKASGQLSGSLDQISWIARGAPLLMWNGAAWFWATEPGAAGISNPGAIVLQLLRGLYRASDGRRIAGVGLADTLIDLASFQEFILRCQAMDFRFDAVIQERMSAGDLIDSVLDAGWARLTRHTGKYGVTWLAEDQPIEGVVNMAAIKARSFLVDYNLAPGADELQYQFFDRDSNWTWQSVRVKAPGTGTPGDTASMAVLGTTRAAQAAMRARLTMAQNAYGRKSISFDLDLEHMAYRAGQVLVISHDLTQWGYGGRLRGITPAGSAFIVSVDEPVPATAAAVRTLGLQLPGEKQMRVWQVTAVSADGRQISVAGAWPGMGAGFGPEDVRWMYDFKATPGQRVRVASIQPQGRMAGATITCLPEDPQFWTYVLAGAWTPPSNNSLLRRGATVTRAVVTEALQRQGATFSTLLTVTFDVQGSYDHAEIWGAAVPGVALRKIGETTNTSFSWITGVDDSWSIEVRPFTALAAGPVYGIAYAVVGLRLPPPDVASVSLNGTVLSWPEISLSAVPDLAGYRVRFNYGSNTDWGVATPMHAGVLTESPYPLQVLPPGPITLLVKAIDTSGNESVGAPYLYANLGDPEVENVLLQRDYRALGWAGTYAGAHVAGGDLVADQSDPFYAVAASRFYPPNPAAAFYTANAAAVEWISERWVVGAGTSGSTMTLAAVVEGSDYRIEYRRPGLSPLYGEASAALYGAPEAAFYPPDEPWQVWPGSLVVGGQGGTYQFRISIGAGPVRGAIRGFVATVDVPDREVVRLRQVIGPGQTRLAAAAGLLNAIKTVRGVLEGGSSATSFQVLDYDAALGPLVQPYVGSQAGGSGNLSFDIKGY